jgi:hypothetical protein
MRATRTTATMGRTVVREEEAMHLTARRGASRWAFLALLVMLTVLALAQAASALAASGPFNGGPVAADCPTVIANDHTVYALRFATTAGTDQLTAGTDYYVKIRFTPNADGSPAGADNRGFTWRPAGTMDPSDPGAWTQERDDWTLFPKVTTDASGAITAGTTWYFFKFGDTAKTGTYRLLVSLSSVSGGSGTTKNCDTPIAVEVIDAATAGYWVHDGAATGKAAKRVEVVDHTAPGLPLALQRTELNLCDDDGDGSVDDEAYGPMQSGGFRMAAPVGQTLDVLIQSIVWPAASSGFASATPDVDVALGAVDQTPPSAPGALTVSRTDDHAALAWSEATDDVAVTGYRIYRWTDAPSGEGYSSPMEVIKTVTDGMSYTDTGLSAGTTYRYIVRGVDAATNVGPRSPKAVSELSLSGPAKVKWGGQATLSGVVTDGGQPLLDGQQVWLERSYNKTTWTRITTPLDPSAGFTYTTQVRPTRTTWYRLAFDGDPSHAAVTSPLAKVGLEVKLGTPVAPKIVAKGKTFAVYGSLVPKHTAGAKNVKIKCYRKSSSGAWTLKKTATARNTNYSTYTRYRTVLSLSGAGSWKLIASYALTSKYAATTSGACYVKAK